MDNIKRLNLAGRHVTEYLIKLLMLRGYAFNSSADFEVVREIKEDICYVSIDIKKERAIAKDTTVLEKEYILPDGSTILVGRERFEAPEILMNPGLLENESDDMATMIYNSICGCPLDIQIPLAESIWLSGGTSMIPGLSTRLENEIKELYVAKKFKGDRKGLERVKV
jgi:actin-related protein 2